MDMHMLAALLLGVVSVITLILRSRLDPFAALLVGALVTGLIAGVSPDALVTSITQGFGATLASIGIVIGLGVMLGKVMEVTGAATVLARMFIRLFGKNREEIAMATTGAVVSVPVFCDTAFVMLHPLVKPLARHAKRSVVALSIALAGGLAISHHMVPPTPGPLAAAALLGLDLGALFAAGALFIIALLPVVIIYARIVGPRLESQRLGFTGDSEEEEQADETNQDEQHNNAHIGPWKALAPILVPVVLILTNTFSQALIPGSHFATLATFFGAPAIALLIGLLLALYTLPSKRTSRETIVGWMGTAAASGGTIIFITGAGGAYGQVLRDSGVGNSLGAAVSEWALPLFMVPFVIATVVRVAQGSGTVAIITAATLSVPLVESGGLDPLLAALAVCAGSMAMPYYNDSYFWVVTRFTGVSGSTALKMHTGMLTTLWLVSIPLLIIASLVL